MPRVRRGKTEINVFVDATLFRRLKAYSAFAGMSMTAMLESLIEEGVPELTTVEAGDSRATEESHAA